jgi:hypothetical protein
LAVAAAQGGTGNSGERTLLFRAASRLSRQRWLTVAALLAVGVGGIVAADTVRA